AKEKDVSSRVGMKRTVDTSVFYDGWLQSIPKDLRDIKKAITEKDFEKLGEISEANCLKMHATTLGAVPPFTYWQDDTMTVMETEVLHLVSSQDRKSTRLTPVTFRSRMPSSA